MTFLYILAIIAAFAIGMWVGSRDDGDDFDEF